jgi:hypothetical protein
MQNNETKMDPVNVIRAPSLKRGKPDDRLSERVSTCLHNLNFTLHIHYILSLKFCGAFLLKKIKRQANLCVFKFNIKLRRSFTTQTHISLRVMEF